MTQLETTWLPSSRQDNLTDAYEALRQESMGSGSLPQLQSFERHFLFLSTGQILRGGLCLDSSAIYSKSEGVGATAHISGLVVAPSDRGQGFGTALLSAALENCSQQQIQWLTASVTPATESIFRSFDFLPPHQFPHGCSPERIWLLPRPRIANALAAGAVRLLRLRHHGFQLCPNIKHPDPDLSKLCVC